MNALEALNQIDREGMQHDTTFKDYKFRIRHLSQHHDIDRALNVLHESHNEVVFPSQGSIHEMAMDKLQLENMAHADGKDTAIESGETITFLEDWI